VNAQLQPVPLVAEKPVYDNELLGYESDWIIANTKALYWWWRDGDSDVHDDDFAIFCRSQHDIELARRDEFKNTLRQY